MQNQHEPVMLETGKSSPTQGWVKRTVPCQGWEGPCSLHCFDHSRVLWWVPGTGKSQAPTKRGVHSHKRTEMGKGLEATSMSPEGQLKKWGMFSLERDKMTTVWQRLHLPVQGRGQKEGDIYYLNIFSVKIKFWSSNCCIPETFNHSWMSIC